MKIYIPSVGAEKSPAPETDDVKIYSCPSEASAAEQSAQTP